MTDRRGFSLVEMVIVLVLAGIVSTSAITMLSTQNRLNAQMTALGESQENARSAVMLAASELHGAAAGSITDATGSSLTIRLPVGIGIVCGSGETADGPGNSEVAHENRPFKHIFVPLGEDGLPIDMVEGFALLQNGTWEFRDESFRWNDRRGAAVAACTADGANPSSDAAAYVTLRLGRGYPTGTPVMFYQVVSYYFAPSVLDPSRRAFFRAAGGQAIELAHGFSDDSHFEYQLQDTTWLASVRRNQLNLVEAVRLVVEAAGESRSGSARGAASFALVREVQLRNIR